MPERAEIEAEVGWTTFWQFAALPHLERMKRVIAAVDRVRDAWDDDDPLGSYMCPRCGSTAVSPDQHRCRSPQGESDEGGNQ